MLKDRNEFKGIAVEDFTEAEWKVITEGHSNESLNCKYYTKKIFVSELNKH